MDMATALAGLGAPRMYRSTVNDYPASIVPVNHVAPVPRRIRAYLDSVPITGSIRVMRVCHSSTVVRNSHDALLESH